METLDRIDRETAVSLPGLPPPSPIRTCFVHIGTHKTGTTSLQVALNRHCTELDGQYYLYPRTGRPTMAPDGHHNIAWEIAGDWRFQRDR